MRDRSIDETSLAGRASGPLAFILLLLPLLTAGGSINASAEPSTFAILQEKSQVGFVSATQLGEFRGATGRVSGNVVVDVRDPARGKLSVTVDPKGLRSDNALRDRHMYEEVFEVARFPAVTFTANQFKRDASAPAGELRGTILGTLALHGVNQPVSVPIRFTVEASTLHGEGNFAINLTDFGITPPRLLGLKVRNEVMVEVRLVAARD